MYSLFLSFVWRYSARRVAFYSLFEYTFYTDMWIYLEKALVWELFVYVSFESFAKRKCRAICCLNVHIDPTIVVDNKSCILCENRCIDLLVLIYENETEAVKKRKNECKMQWNVVHDNMFFCSVKELLSLQIDVFKRNSSLEMYTFEFYRFPNLNEWNPSNKCT